MQDPIARFASLLERARATDLPEPTAVALATADSEGRPSVRMVLLKGFDQDGFVFYTNLQSQKARELAENPNAALCFHWQPLEAQVRVAGPVSRVTDAEADAYFESRPRGSQVGAWASRQSQPLESYARLEDRAAEIHVRFADRPIPRPHFWSGFRLSPTRIEFWSARPSRLHEREVFIRDPQSGEWGVQLLYP
ncbi:MAG: pyridoxamine 5'-phosphate oxidase [Gemmatimonadota bacterium]